VNDDEDVLDALAGRVFARLNRYDRRAAEAAAVETLKSRHGREYADLREAAARRIAEKHERRRLF
jgi:hypothetical protein